MLPRCIQQTRLSCVDARCLVLAESWGMCGSEAKPGERLCEHKHGHQGRVRSVVLGEERAGSLLRQTCPRGPQAPKGRCPSSETLWWPGHT